MRRLLLAIALLLPCSANADTVGSGGLNGIIEPGSFVGGTLTAPLLLANVPIYNPSGVLSLGSTCTTSHSLGTGATCSGGSLEVNGVLYADGTLTVAGAASFSTGFKISDFIYLNLGTTSGNATQAGVILNTAQPVAAPMLVPNTASQYWLMVDRDDAGYNFGHAAQTNPTLFIHSSAQSTTEYIALSHNQTNAVITAGSGVVQTSTGIDIQDGGTRPTCSSTTRGTVWMDEGGAGVADSFAICAKDAGDAYAWRTIY